MAATVSVWAKPGAWARDSEEHEEELLQQKKEEADTAKNHSNGGDAAALSDFPSLSAAATTKTKKKKGQTVSLAAFSTGAYSVPNKQAQNNQAKGLTTEDLMMLPTGPRERTADEMDRSRLGGGFRSYGSNDRNNNRYSNGGGDESSVSKWGSSRGVSDETRRLGGGFGGRDSNREFAPSRADEIDDWGAGKKSTVGGGFERRERGEKGGFFDSQSRADESESWVSNKSFVPSFEGRRFGSTGGGGGFESLRERRGVGFESNGGGADSDNWGKKKEGFGAGGGAFDSLRERRGGYESNDSGGGDSDSWGKKREEGTGGGGRPRLNLQPRKVPVGEEQQANGTWAVKAKGSNPFGEARPREEVLKEKGQEWKEIDEKLESTKIKDVAFAGTGSTDGPSFWKRSFGSGNGSASFPDDRSESSWRKPDSIDVRPPSAEKSENGLVDEAEDNDPQM